MSVRDERRRPEARWPRWSLVVVGVLATGAAGLRLAVTRDPYTGHLLAWLLVLGPVVLLGRQAGSRGALFGATAGLVALLVAELAAGPLRGVDQAWTVFAGGAALYVSFALGIVVGLRLRDRAWIAVGEDRTFLARFRRLLPGGASTEREGGPRREADRSEDVKARLRELMLAAESSGEPVAAVVIELEGLAALPDSGQRAVVAAVEDQLGERHHLVRIGSTRLVALLPGETSASASVMAERMRANVAPVAAEDGPTLGFDAGVAAAGGGDPRAPELLDHAEAALEQAIRLTGDRIMVRDGGAFREGPVRPAYGR